MRNDIIAIERIGTRTIFVSMLFQVAYKDDNSDFVICDNIREESELVPSSDCLLKVEDRLFICTSHGRIFRSTGIGETWQVIEDGNLISREFYLLTYSSGRIFACSPGGIIYSDDLGDTWECVLLEQRLDGIVEDDPVETDCYA